MTLMDNSKLHDGLSWSLKAWFGRIVKITTASVALQLKYHPRAIISSFCLRKTCPGTLVFDIDLSLAFGIKRKEWHCSLQSY